MKYFLTVFFLCIFVVAGQASPQIDGVKRIIQSSGQKLSNFGIWVGRNQKQVLAFQENKKFIPASITKIITAAAVLETMGLDKEFVSEFKAEQDINNGVTQGDLCFVGGGVPGFTSEKLWNLINELNRTGLKEVKGDLIVDSTYFKQNLFPSERGQERIDRAYDAPVSASSFNWNSVNVFIRPTSLNQKAKIILDPISEYFILKNKTKTISGTKSNIRVSRETINKKDYIIVKGNIGLNSKEKVFYKSVSDPDLWMGYQAKAFLLRRGITIKGKIKKQTCSVKAKLVADVVSKPMDLIIRDLMKFSNNYIAEMLTLHLAKERNVKANLASGMQSIHNYLKKIGWKSKDYILESPSGLSRKNRLKPKLVGELLGRVQRNFFISSSFLNALPVAGVDGTLKKRMIKGWSSYTRVRGKTGLLDGVASMAGYFQATKDKDVFSFAIIYNGNKHFKARDTIDKILEHLVEKL